MASLLSVANRKKGQEGWECTAWERILERVDTRDEMHKEDGGRAPISQIPRGQPGSMCRPLGLVFKGGSMICRGLKSLA